MTYALDHGILNLKKNGLGERMKTTQLFLLIIYMCMNLWILIPPLKHWAQKGKKDSVDKLDRHKNLYSFSVCI